MNAVALINARIYTAAEDRSVSPIIEKGTVVFQDGKITAVGENVAIPENAQVIDVSNRIVTPGLIDAQCHIGLSEDGVGRAGNDLNESTNPVTPEVRVLDGINPADIAFRDAVASGVTCVQVTPGSGNIIGGETLVIKTRGTVVEDMVVRRPSGLMAALGEDPKRAFGSNFKPPLTRMGSAAIMRKALAAARDYARKKDAAVKSEQDAKESGKSGSGRLPELNPGHESLIRVLRKEIPLRVHCHRADDIVTAIRIAKEFDINISLEHCAEGDKVLELLAESGFPVTMGPGLTKKSKLETKDAGFAAPVAVSRAGVKLAIVTDHPALPIQYLRICAGLAVREGMDEDTALLAITRYAAEILGVADRTGSIEPGKDADIVVWSKDPFEYDAKVEYTFIDGKPVDTRDGHDVLLGGDIL